MTISSPLFEAFLKCPTKCHLRSLGETGSGNEYSDWVRAQDESYEREAIRRLQEAVPETERVAAPSAGDSFKSAKWRMAVNIVAQASSPASSGSVSLPERTPGGTPGELAVGTTALQTRLHAIERIPSEGRGKAVQFIPIRFIWRNKLTKDDKLLLAFDAFVLSESLGRDIPLGKIIHGDLRSCARQSAAISQEQAGGEQTNSPPETTSAALSRAQPQVTKVKTSALFGEVRKLLAKIAALLASEKPPDLVLNRHCVECEFRDRCRQKAIEADDLSLLAGMSAKERQRLRSKGIFTVTQLSYTFRPRRRPKRLRDKREKYHHALKALAIREKKIHIVGSPELKIEGTPVYLDVEGLPDRDFYYLIGLRIGHGDTAVQHSLWADTVADEGKIWREFLAILETIEKPVLIHYGSYETTFLKRMSERHSRRTQQFANSDCTQSGTNLLGVIYGRIYFPTYSNRLKELARAIRASTSDTATDGINTIVWRSAWETSHNASLKDKLFAYNQSDCVLLQALTSELGSIAAASHSRQDVEDANNPKNPLSKTAAAICEVFERVLKSAFSDYKGRRISLTPDLEVQSNPSTTRRPRLRYKRKMPPSKARPKIVPRKRTCPAHPGVQLRPRNKIVERRLFDISFTKSGCRKTQIVLAGRLMYCPVCGTPYVPPAFRHVGSKIFGNGIRAWVVYQRVALRMSHGLISQAGLDLFHEEFHKATISGLEASVADAHRSTESLLLTKVLSSPFIHVDETRLSILGVHHYVWTLTDGQHVVFRLTPSRETRFLADLLTGYRGTLVSDFYGGYDSIGCQQQKCLVHLIGDLNNDLWKNPFDVEYEHFVASVRDLLIPLFVDVQKFGLKARNLRKHIVRVDRFYRENIDGKAECQNLTAKYQKRFERYRRTMFTFLEKDGIPWNNNAAERALRHLAVQRKISGAFSSNGATRYLRLLAIYQTCRFQDKSFLGFLLSGLHDVDAYKMARGGRRRRSLINKPIDSGADEPAKT